MKIFQEDIPQLIEDNVIPQLTTGLTQEMLQTNIMPNKENKNNDPSDSKPQNVRLNEEIINDKYEKIKDKLLKSFLNKKIQTIKENEINFKSLPIMLKYLKIYKDNILMTKNREVSYYINIGKIIKNIKSLHPVAWINILKKNQIVYSLQYLNFLIQLHDLFQKHKKLNNSVLTISFFKKNFNIIENIANKEF